MGAKLAVGGARRRGRRSRGAPMSEINVTPFVDVMLVLLIIFMVAAPLLTVGVPLQLPETQANALPQEDEPPLTVNLGADGIIYLQETPVSYAELAQRLPAIRTERTDGKVYLRADAGLDYGRVAEVMGALDSAGFKSISLVTDSRSGDAATPVPETTGGN
ncbi:MAG: ExbD/TolR family protein [Pseudomonadota bacterium]